MRRRRSNKKSQVWVSDYTISLLLFVLAVLLSVKIVINSFSADTQFEELKTDASKISEILLSEGYPPDWHNESVIRPGVLTAKRLNATKVINAMNMSYTALRPKFQTAYDFLVVFEEREGNLTGFDGFCAIGSPDVVIINTSIPVLDCHAPDFTSILPYDNMVRISRLVINGTDILRMVTYVWS